MIAKGHDIPNVTLVGVVSAPTSASGMPDFRAAERTFQLLTQVAGRAGRGSLPGIVLVQTINPDHYAVRLAAAQDYQAFYEKELNFRRMMHYPPFAAMANVLVRSEKKEVAMRMAPNSGPPDAAAGEAARDGAGRSAGAAAEERVPLPVPDQGRQPQGAQRVLNGLREFAAARKWNATALVLTLTRSVCCNRRVADSPAAIVAANLREAMRFFGQATGRGGIERDGITVIDSGIDYAVFNISIFGPPPIAGRRDFTTRLKTPEAHFDSRRCDGRIGCVSIFFRPRSGTVRTRCSGLTGCAG